MRFRFTNQLKNGPGRPALFAGPVPGPGSTQQKAHSNPRSLFSQHPGKPPFNQPPKGPRGRPQGFICHRPAGSPDHPRLLGLGLPRGHPDIAHGFLSGRFPQGATKRTCGPSQTAGAEGRPPWQPAQTWPRRLRLSTRVRATTRWAGDRVGINQNRLRQTCRGSLLSPICLQETGIPGHRGRNCVPAPVTPPAACFHNSSGKIQLGASAAWEAAITSRR